MLGPRTAAPGQCLSKRAALAPQHTWPTHPPRTTSIAAQSLSTACTSTSGRTDHVRCRAQPRDSTSAAASGRSGKPQPPQALQQQEEEEEEEEEEDEEEGEWDEGEDEMGEYEFEEGDEWEDEDEFEEGEELYEEGEEEGELGEGEASSSSGGQEEQEGSRARQIPEDALEAEYTEGDFVEVGYITDAHGLKGEVKIKPITDEPKRRFGKVGRRLWLETPAPEGLLASKEPSKAPLRRLVVERGRVLRPQGNRQKEVWGVKFKDVADRTQAEALSHHRLLLAVCDRERIPRGSAQHLYYVQDLVGLRAFMAATGQLLGEVVEVHDGTGTYDTLRIRLVPNKQDIEQSQYRTVLVPFAKEIVPTVDTVQRRLELSPPEGLLELSHAWKLRRPYTPAQQQQLLQQLQALEAQRAQQQPAAEAATAAGSSEVASAPATAAEGDAAPDKPAKNKTPRGSQRKERRAAARAAAAGSSEEGADDS